MTVLSTFQLRQLVVKTQIGLYPWEKAIKQVLWIDLDLVWDIALAGQTDDLTQSLDYSDLVAFIKAFSDQARYELVEAFSVQLLAQLREKYSLIQSGRLVVHKPYALKEVSDLAFELSWP